MDENDAGGVRAYLESVASRMNARCPGTWEGAVLIEVITADMGDRGVSPGLAGGTVSMDEEAFFTYLTETLNYTAASARELIDHATWAEDDDSDYFEVAGQDGSMHEVAVDASEGYKGVIKFAVT